MQKNLTTNKERIEKNIVGENLMEYVRPQNGRNLLKDMGENPLTSPLRAEVMHLCYNLSRVFDGGQQYSTEEANHYIEEALIGKKYQMTSVSFDDGQKAKIREILYKELCIE